MGTDRPRPALCKSASPQKPAALQQVRLPLPCTLSPHTYHDDMDSPTFVAPQRIMDSIRPQVGRDRQSTDDWLRVIAWMDEVATEIDDLETLGTGDPRREVR
jgi:hypothetical protein